MRRLGGIDSTAGRRPRRRRSLRAWVAGITVILLALGGAYVLLIRPAWIAPLYQGGPPPTPEAAGPETAPGGTEQNAPAGAEPEAAPPQPLPSLAASDPLVRELARGLSPQPALSAWLSMEGLLQRFVAVVDNIADGVSPGPHLLFLAPTAKFHTVSQRGRLYVDPKSYERYDAIANVIGSLDAQRAVAVYRQLQPLCEEAYQALGHPQGGFDDALARAIRRLLATPVVEGDIELTPKVITYAFVAPELEGLSPAQKHFLRMGPRNVRQIQAELRALASSLGTAGNELP